MYDKRDDFAVGIKSFSFLYGDFPRCNTNVFNNL